MLGDQQVLQQGHAGEQADVLKGARDAVLDDAVRIQPGQARAVEGAVEEAAPDLGFVRLDAEAFGRAPQKSIDYAVMERTDKAAVVEGRFRWSDIGSWDAVFDIAPRDDAGNVTSGPVATMDTEGCVIHAEDRLTVALGVKDLVVVTTPDAVWHDTFASNVHGLFYLTRAVLPLMIAQGRGVIVNNASDWGLVGAQNALAYAASKGAVVQITRSLALDHGRQGIRVNAVCPGDTLVERWRETGCGGAGAAATPGEFAAYLDELGSAFALGRVGQTAEIARAVLFLACDDSSYMTGALLTVDGGNTAGGSSARF